MSGLLSVGGFLGLVLALVGVIKGSLRSVGLTTRQQCLKAAAAAFVVMVVGGALAPDPGPREGAAPAAAAASPAPVAAPAARAKPPSAGPTPAVARSTAPPASRQPAPPEPARTAATVVPLLVMAAGGDGDSWRDTNGVEYRMGLINTPEADECGGAVATDYRKRALAGGFRAKVYSMDRYGRKVAVIVAPNGVNLNVAMARDGIANDEYLEQFRHENPGLAGQLDAAFAEARAAGRGIWTTCARSREAAAAQPARPAQQQPAPASGCHPDYRTCIPVVGDGSGRGAANDLDCGEIERAVYLRQVGRDPYRLDGSDQDGVGCE